MSQMSEKDIKRKNGDMKAEEERKLIWIPNDTKVETADGTTVIARKRGGRRPKVLPILDKDLNIVNKKELSTNAFIKAADGGPCKTYKGRPRRHPNQFYDIVNDHKLISMIRCAVKDIVSTNAYHTRNQEELVKRMEMQGNAEEWEFESVKISSELLMILGKRQKENLFALFKEYVKDPTEADEIMKMLIEQEKKKQEAKRNESEKDRQNV